MPTYIDTHCHLFDSAFEPDRSAVAARAQAAGLALMLMPNIDSTTYSSMCAVADTFATQCLPMLGVHPTSITASNVDNEISFVRRTLSAATRRFIAVGEIGVDCYWSKEFLEQQLYAFDAQLRMAEQHRLPVVIHARNSYPEIMRVLRQNSYNVRGVFHAFSGSTELYRELKSLGNFCFGIGGVVTFKNAGLAQTLRSMDLGDLLLETDAPYLTPVPHRGQRNESSYLPLVAQKIAEAKGITVEQVAEETTRNAAKIFGDLRI